MERRSRSCGGEEGEELVRGLGEMMVEGGRWREMYQMDMSMLPEHLPPEMSALRSPAAAPKREELSEKGILLDRVGCDG